MTRVEAKLEDVRSSGDGAILISMRRITGFEDAQLATATIAKPTEEIERILRRIGRAGTIG